MIATYINCLTVLVGSLIGLLFHAHISADFKKVIFSSAGLISLLVGLQMALATQSYLKMLLSIAAGGILGYLLDLEGANLSAVGGDLVIMIGFNLLGVKEFKTANFLPALVVIVVLASISPWISQRYLQIIG
jgi:uncharacterized membrane protein YqgA involved in biofilm formation